MWPWPAHCASRETLPRTRLDDSGRMLIYRRGNWILLTIHRPRGGVNLGKPDRDGTRTISVGRESSYTSLAVGTLHTKIMQRTRKESCIDCLLLSRCMGLAQSSLGARDSHAGGPSGLRDHSQGAGRRLSGRAGIPGDTRGRLRAELGLPGDRPRVSAHGQRRCRLCLSEQRWGPRPSGRGGELQRGGPAGRGQGPDVRGCQRTC